MHEYKPMNLSKNQIIRRYKILKEERKNKCQLMVLDKMMRRMDEVWGDRQSFRKRPRFEMAYGEDEYEHEYDRGRLEIVRPDNRDYGDE